ncbi:MAG: hypothetical protein IJ709_13415 [Selenomonas sp.]|nr:hypothetical protein [Selenomonas sp.]
MINLEELTFDPDFCTTFTVEKHSGVWHEGKQAETATTIEVTLIVPPSSAKDVQMMELAHDKHGTKTFYTNEVELEVSDTEKTSDTIVWKGNRYKLLHVFDYSANGYWKAIGDLKGGAQDE